jgi:hypothetical protein
MWFFLAVAALDDFVEVKGFQEDGKRTGLSGRDSEGRRRRSKSIDIRRRAGGGGC